MPEKSSINRNRISIFVQWPYLARARKVWSPWPYIVLNLHCSGNSAKSLELSLTPQDRLFVSGHFKSNLAFWFFFFFFFDILVSYFLQGSAWMIQLRSDSQCAVALIWSSPILFFFILFIGFVCCNTITIIISFKNILHTHNIFKRTLCYL